MYIRCIYLMGASSYSDNFYIFRKGILILRVNSTFTYYTLPKSRLATIYIHDITGTKQTIDQNGLLNRRLIALVYKGFWEGGPRLMLQSDEMCSDCFG